IVYGAPTMAADANNIGLMKEMDAILCVVLGGTSLMGGKFYLGGTVVGALILTTIERVVIIFHIPSQTTPLFKAIVTIAGRTALRRATDRRYMPVAGSVLTLVLMLVVGEMRYGGSSGFLTPRLVSNLLVDNSYLLVLAIGMTFVIITGGIDLSVGAVVALTGLVIATLLPMGLPLPVVLLVAVLIGSTMGLIIGVMVQVFDIQPFIASLGVMFLARGLANVV